MCGTTRDQQCFTSQSSTLASYISSNANDGVKISGFSHTDGQGSTDPWWMVDFGSSLAVASGMVWGRYDGCCESRMDGFEVWIGTNPNYPAGNGNSMCFVDTANDQDYAPYTQAFSCIGIGRYLFVVLPGTNRILTLTEVEVYPPATGLCAC